MGCCDKKAPIDGIYVPLSKRLVEFGIEIYGDILMEKFKYTHVWVFSFYENADMCEDCQIKFAAMNKWFMDYGLFDDPIRNVKWIVEDQPGKNLIYQEMGFKKTPMHIFTDSEGKIFDIVMGFPTAEWLEKYILPLIRQGTKLI